MKNSTPIIYCLLAIALALTSCDRAQSNKNNTGKPEDAVVITVEEQTPPDAKALSDAYSKSMFEKAMADSIKSNSTNTYIKELAETMIAGHATINNQIKALATEKSIALPPGLTPEQEIKIAGLKSKKQDELARDYTTNLVDEHNYAIRTYQQQVSACNDPDIKEWFQNSLRLLNSQLDMANLYKKKLEEKK